MQTKYTIEYTREFLRDAKRCRKRGLNMLLLEGKYTGHWECHIQPDWLLVWRQDNYQLTLLFTNTGTHSDIFK